MRCSPHRVQEMMQRAARVKVLILDVDGVLTPGQIVHHDQGGITKYFNALDGLGIKLAASAGLTVAIITASTSDAIRHRAADLGITHLYLGRYDKGNAFAELLSNLDVSEAEICYMGDDLPDYPVMARVGLPVAPANGARIIRQLAGLTTDRRGGEGAIREAIEFILFAQGRLDAEHDRLLDGLSRERLT